MNKIDNHLVSNEDVLSLYLLTGEALCAIQHLEDCLSHSIIIKNDIKYKRSRSRNEANMLLTEYRADTLGKAIKIAIKEDLYAKEILENLKSFLSDRNWLIHKSIAQNRDDWDANAPDYRNILLTKVKTITQAAQNLILILEDDLIKATEENGMDTTRIKEEIYKKRSN